jgi:hypothetical protein
MNDPFDWRNYKPQVSFKDLEKARRNAYQASKAVNDARKQGIEPSCTYAERVGAHMAGLPQDYAIDMPVMPMNKKAARRKEKREQR